MRASQFIPNSSDAMHESVAGPKKCWPGHRKVGTQPGTGKNAGKRVNDCEKIGEENKGLYYNVNKRKKAGTSIDASHPKAPTAQAWKDAAKTAKKESVAGPENCWPGHRKVGTKPGTGKNAGKRVNDCEKIGEATSAAQQAAIAIAKKKAGKK